MDPTAVARRIQNLSFLDCLVQLEKNKIEKTWIEEAPFFNCVRKPFFVSDQNPAVSIHVSDW